MYPILYAANMVTEGTVPAHYGKGTLSDCISCECSEERNGGYELTLVYPITGIHANEIEANDILKVKANAIDPLQLFRIYHVGKAMNGKFTVKAAHVSYDLSGKIMDPNVTATTAAMACAALQACAGNFTFATDISSSTPTKPFYTDKPKSVRSWLRGNNNGSLTAIFAGTADWYFNNYNCMFLADRGLQHDVPIRYSKNLTDLSQDVDIDNLVTAIVPYYIDKDTNQAVMGTEVSTGLSINVDRKLAIDFTSQIDFDSQVTPAAQMQTLATAYVSEHASDLIYPVQSLSISFIDDKETNGQVVNLCDTAKVTFDALGISASYKCVAIIYDTIAERYKKATLGVVRPDVSDTLLRTAQRVSESVTRNEMTTEVTKEVTKEVTEQVTEKVSEVISSGEEDANFASVLSKSYTLGEINSVDEQVDPAGMWDCVPTSWSRFRMFPSWMGSVDYPKTAFQIYTESGNPHTTLTLFCNSDESDSTRVVIGVTLADDAYIRLTNHSNVENIKLTSSDGNITCVSLTQTSSRKVKDHIKPMTIAEIRKVLLLKPVTFDFKDRDYGTDKRGFIAEDVAKVIPQLVTQKDDGTPASLDYIQIIPYLVGIIKDQEERIKALEDKLL